MAEFEIQISMSHQVLAFVTDKTEKNSVITQAEVDQFLSKIEKSKQAEAKEHLSKQLIDAGIHDSGSKVYTTTDVIETEKNLIADAIFMAANQKHNLTDQEIQAAIDKKEREASKKSGNKVRMTQEQRDSTFHGMRGGFSIVQGSAGAGKSFSAEVLRIGYQDKGYEVIGAAVAKRAAQSLQDETGIQSVTLAKLIKDLNSGKKTLTDKSIVVMDEAGLVGTKDFATLLFHAKHAGAKVVATGEDKQLGSISSGGALKYLSRPDVVGCARIENIMRQEDPLMRNAVMNLRDGKVKQALMTYQDRGLLNFSETKKEAIDELISAWQDFDSKQVGKNAKQSLIIAHTNADVRAIGERVREIRKNQGKITGDEITVDCAHGENKFQIQVAVGERIRLNKNDESLGVMNGDIGTVTMVKADAEEGFNILIQLDRGDEVSINTLGYSTDGRANISSAYAMTVYSSQGVTVKGDTFVLQTSSMDRANTYVAASRAKNDTHFYVGHDDIKSTGALVKLVSRDDSKKLAIESTQLGESIKMDEAQKREEAGKQYAEQQKQMLSAGSAHNEPLLSVDNAIKSLISGEKPKVMYGSADEEKKASEKRQGVISDQFPFHSADAFYADNKFTVEREALQIEFETSATPENASLYYNQYSELKASYAENMQIALLAEEQIKSIEKEYGQSFADIDRDFTRMKEEQKHLGDYAKESAKEVVNHYTAMHDKAFSQNANTYYQNAHDQKRNNLEATREVGGKQAYYHYDDLVPEVPGKKAMIDNVANVLDSLGAKGIADSLRGISDSENRQMRVAAEKQATHEIVAEHSHKTKHAKTAEDKQWHEAARSLAIHSYNANRYEDAIERGLGTPELKEKLDNAKEKIAMRAIEMSQLDLQRQLTSPSVKAEISKVMGHSAAISQYVKKTEAIDKMKDDVKLGRDLTSQRDHAINQSKLDKRGIELNKEKAIEANAPKKVNPRLAAIREEMLEYEKNEPVKSKTESKTESYSR